MRSLEITRTKMPNITKLFVTEMMYVQKEETLLTFFLSQNSQTSQLLAF
tara:strand:+ start:737 stop:883 length:147 start_codon:yes stop_codon:yes gene_type:complete